MATKAAKVPGLAKLQSEVEKLKAKEKKESAALKETRDKLKSKKGDLAALKAGAKPANGQPHDEAE